MEYKTELLASGTKVCVNKNHRFGTDAMLLSHFCEVKRLQTACDFGTGCGIIPLRWRDMGHIGQAVGVEISEEAAALFEIGIKENQADNITAVHADLRTWQAEKPFDVISCNPPYFTGGFVSPNAQRGTARHQVSCTMQDMCAAAARNLKDGGRFCICQRPQNLADVMACMRTVKLEPKRLRFVKQRQGAEVPWLFLLDSRKNGGIGLSVLPDLIMEDENGGFSAEVLQIYGKISALPQA